MARKKISRPYKCDRCGLQPKYVLELRKTPRGLKYQACEKCFKILVQENTVLLCANHPGINS